MKNSTTFPVFLFLRFFSWKQRIVFLMVESSMFCCQRTHCLFGPSISLGQKFLLFVRKVVIFQKTFVKHNRAAHVKTHPLFLKVAISFKKYQFSKTFQKHFPKHSLKTIPTPAWKFKHPRLPPPNCRRPLRPSRSQGRETWKASADALG